MWLPTLSTYLTTEYCTILPIITAWAEAQEEANQLNVINQVVIGPKEGAADAITKLVGSNITETILRTPNGSDHKGQAFNVMQAAINGADCSLTSNMLEQLF